VGSFGFHLFSLTKAAPYTTRLLRPSHQDRDQDEEGGTRILGQVELPETGD